MIGSTFVDSISVMKKSRSTWCQMSPNKRSSNQAKRHTRLPAACEILLLSMTQRELDLIKFMPCRTVMREDLCTRKSVVSRPTPAYLPILACLGLPSCTSSRICLYSKRIELSRSTLTSLGLPAKTHMHNIHDNPRGLCLLPRIRTVGVALSHFAVP